MKQLFEDLQKLFFYPDCLYCHKPRQPETSWTSLIYGDHSVLCQDCEEKLEPLTGDLCAMCSRSFTNLDPTYRTGEICYDCFRWEKNPEWAGLLYKNESLYHYNDFLKEVIAQYKFRGDYVLAQIFHREMKLKIKHIKPDVIVPIPLSAERLIERGFNQVEAILTEGAIPFSRLLTRIHSEKQSKKAREDRLAQSNFFQWSSEESVSEKRILLLDDVYTTGSTIRQAAKLLKEKGAADVVSLTIAR